MQLVFKHLKTFKVSDWNVSCGHLRIRNIRSLILTPLSPTFMAGPLRSMRNCETQQRQIMERDLICDTPRGGELHLWAELINAFGIWIGTSPRALDSKHSISLPECCRAQINGLSCCWVYLFLSTSTLRYRGQRRCSGCDSLILVCRSSTIRVAIA